MLVLFDQENMVICEVGRGLENKISARLRYVCEQQIFFILAGSISLPRLKRIQKFFSSERLDWALCAASQHHSAQHPAVGGASVLC